MEAQENHEKKKKRKPFSLEEKEEIIRISYKYTASELAKMYNCSRGAILNLWCRMNYKKNDTRHYYVNENYFKDINTGNKAYLIGFIAADGNIYARNRKNHQAVLQISINKRDEDLLIKIIEDMESTHPITHTGSEEREMSKITFTSDIICNDLRKIGLSENKTWILDIEYILNNIPKNLHRHFFRGYFDGDGFFSCGKKDLPSRTDVGYVMPMNNIKKIYDYFLNIGIKAHYKEDVYKTYSHPFGTLFFYGSNKYIFLKYIYDDVGNSLFLKRKYNRVYHFFDLVENNYCKRPEHYKTIIKYNEFIKTFNNTE